MGDEMFNKMAYVYAVYKEKSFTKAAEKLYISQPCLSAAIKKIEEELGMPLFERRYADVRPTKIGLEYIEATEKIMNIEQGFSAKINETDLLQFGSLKVGGTNYVSSYLLPVIIREFSKLYPKIEVTLIETKSVELEKMLENEELDLFIDSFDAGTSSQECYPLLEEKILLAVPKNCVCNNGLDEKQILPHNIAEGVTKEPVSIKQFENEKFILLKSGNNMYKHAVKIFSQANIAPEIAFKLDQLSTSYNFTASGCGVCFVTDAIFKYHRFTDDVVLYNLKEKAERTLYVVKKKNKFATQAMKKFIEIAEKSIG